MGLHLWGGSSKDKISAQSWEHESAGSGTGRTDTVPKKIVDFIRTTLPSRSSKTGSTVILCHDLTQSDVSGVKADILALEKAAAQHNTVIEYYTMSGLFKQLTGKNP